MMPSGTSSAGRLALLAPCRARGAPLAPAEGRTPFASAPTQTIVPQVSILPLAKASVGSERKRISYSQAAKLREAGHATAEPALRSSGSHIPEATTIFSEALKSSSEAATSPAGSVASSSAFSLMARAVRPQRRPALCVAERARSRDSRRMLRPARTVRLGGTARGRRCAPRVGRGVTPQALPSIATPEVAIFAA
eukprot:scaffold1280_cov379-Prasinococcus_capsulatus_cf.AAC.26